MRIFCNGYTAKGNREGRNQDAIGMFTDGKKGIFVVADGMGDKEYGAVASLSIVETARECWEFWKRCPLRVEKILERLQSLLDEKNSELCEFSKTKKMCGSTVAILVIQGEQTGLLSVGDSRIYIYRGEQAFQVTPDDVWDNLADTKLNYTMSQCLTHPNHGKLTQAFGIHRKIDYHVQVIENYSNKSFLLVSDGVYQCCSTGSLKKCVRDSENEALRVASMNQLIQEIEQNGASDNYAMINVTLVDSRYP